MTKQPLGPNQKKWLAALRSDDFKEGTYNLNKNGKFCCLGVAAELFKTKDTKVSKSGYLVTYDDFVAKAPPYVISDLGLLSDLGKHKFEYKFGPKSLANLNDEGMSFKDIADMIEADPSAYFKDSR